MSKERELSVEQIISSEKLFLTMPSKSKALGTPLIELEKKLDQHFSSGQIDLEKLENTLSSIAIVKANIVSLLLFLTKKVTN